MGTVTNPAERLPDVASAKAMRTLQGPLIQSQTELNSANALKSAEEALNLKAIREKTTTETGAITTKLPLEVKKMTQEIATLKQTAATAGTQAGKIAQETKNLAEKFIQLKQKGKLISHFSNITPEVQKVAY